MLAALVGGRDAAGEEAEDAARGVWPGGAAAAWRTRASPANPPRAPAPLLLSPSTLTLRSCALALALSVLSRPQEGDSPCSRAPRALGIVSGGAAGAMPPAKKSPEAKASATNGKDSGGGSPEKAPLPLKTPPVEKMRVPTARAGQESNRGGKGKSKDGGGGDSNRGGKKGKDAGAAGKKEDAAAAGGGKKKGKLGAVEEEPAEKVTRLDAACRPLWGGSRGRDACLRATAALAHKMHGSRARVCVRARVRACARTAWARRRRRRPLRSRRRRARTRR